jgi:hypothetical protein
MIIAKSKVKINIGEYILYMFQIEDIIRACEFNKNIIEEKIVSQYDVNDDIKNEIKEWYFGLTDMMINEKIEKNGHLQFLINRINEIYDFHLFLMQNNDFKDYQNKFNAIYSIVNELKAKQKSSVNDIDVILNAIYGVYLLKLQKRAITPETIVSTTKLSGILADLSEKFHDYEIGKINLE